MKRFTETTKWDDPWFRKLTPKLKCLWLFLCDRCDSAGVIEVDYELAGVHIGTKINEQDVADLGPRIEKLECGKWWIVRFVAFQYGKLSEDCKAHGPVLSSLESYGLMDRVLKGYAKGMNTPKDNKEKDKCIGGGEGGTKLITARKHRGTVEEISDYCESLGLPRHEGQILFDKWEGNGWTNGGEPIRDWKATIRTWKARGFIKTSRNGTAPIVSRSDMGDQETADRAQQMQAEIFRKIAEGDDE